MEEYILIKMEDALDRVQDTIKLLEMKQLTNCQEVLDWLDELNKLSVKY